MGIFLNAVYSKIDVFVKFESAINLEIKVQIKKKMDSFYLGHKDPWAPAGGSKGERSLPPGNFFFFFKV